MIMFGSYDLWDLYFNIIGCDLKDTFRFIFIIYLKTIHQFHAKNYAKYTHSARNIFKLYI